MIQAKSIYVVSVVLYLLFYFFRIASLDPDLLFDYYIFSY